MIKISVLGAEDRIKTPSEYLTDLIEQIENDIFPLLFFTKGHAPFTVTRNLFCFLDHLSKIQYGNKSKTLQKMLESPNDFFGNFGSYKYIQKRYSEIADYLIQLYRNELIHHIRPYPKMSVVRINDKKGKVKTSKFTEVGFYLSSRINKKTVNNGVMKFEQMCLFMKDEKNRKNFCHLRSNKEFSTFVFNNFCFMFDVVEYLKRYSEKLKNNQPEQQKFSNNYHQIVKDNLLRPKTELILDRYHTSEESTDATDEEINIWYRKMREDIYFQL